MPLPVLSTPTQPSPADLLRHYLRCEHHWVSVLAEDETVLEGATALTNPAMAGVWDANHVRDAEVHEGATAEQVVACVDAHFAARGVRCAYYVMNPSSPAGRTAPLREYLLGSGFYVD